MSHSSKLKSSTSQQVARSSSRRRKSSSNSRRVPLAPESLERRRLMAADAFDFQILEDPESQAIVTEVYETVDQLAGLVQRDAAPEQIEGLIEQGQHDVLWGMVDAEQWRSIVDAAEIPNLGPAIGQTPMLGQSLNGMVIMELMGLPEQAPEYTQQMNFFLNELDCQLDLFVDVTGHTSELPPQFEQLRQELGDASFAEWLHSNQQQTGTLAGVTEDVIGELDPRQLQQLDQEEAALDQWLRAFHDGTSTELEIPEPIEVLRVELGDQWFHLWLESNANLFGNRSGLPEQTILQLELEDPGLFVFQQQEQALDAWVRDIGSQIELPTNVDVDVPSSFQGQLPEAYEQMRLALGNEGFAEWLEANRGQFGNHLGVQDAGWLLDELASTEATLESWLESFRFQPTVFEVAGDTDGDGTVAFNDFLTLSSNFGMTVDSGYLVGDFDLDGVVAFSDFLVLSSNFGTTTIDCGCDVSDANNPDGATKIQGAGELKIRDGSMVFVSDNTVPGDAAELKKDAPDGTPIHTGMKSWQDVIDKIKDLPDGSIKGDLVISGHGADGGVDGSAGDIDGEELTAEQAAILKKKLGKDARIVVLGCCQANKQEDEHMQRMADLTGVPVVGNQGSVNNGANGKDDWFRFDPKPKK